MWLKLLGSLISESVSCSRSDVRRRLTECQSVIGDWQELAECRGADASVWYPMWMESGDDGTIGAPISIYNEAKAVCSHCEVRPQCLDYAMETKERYGCWGGLAPIERLRIERKHRRQRLVAKRRAEEHNDDPSDS
jgi:WhiB family redox-sensing transcriptional regulator